MYQVPGKVLGSSKDITCVGDFFKAEILNFACMLSFTLKSKKVIHQRGKTIQFTNFIHREHQKTDCWGGGAVVWAEGCWRWITHHGRTRRAGVSPRRSAGEPLQRLEETHPLALHEPPSNRSERQPSSRNPQTHLPTGPLCNFMFSVTSFNTASQSSLVAWNSFRLNRGPNRSPFLNTLGQRAAW